MKCLVYKSKRKPDTYLYLDQTRALETLPDSVRTLLGELELVMELDLTPERKLARESTAVVLANLGNSGFHIQFPPNLVFGGA